MAMQFTQALLGPGQMIIFFQCSAFHIGANTVQSSRKCLPLVQGLGGYFTGVIYPHQAGYVARFIGRQIAIFDVTSRIRALGGVWRAEHCSQRVVGLINKRIQG